MAAPLRILGCLLLALPIVGCSEPPAGSETSRVAPPPGAAPAPHRAPGDIARIAADNGPAVVNIATTRHVPHGDGVPGLPERFRGTPLEELFRRFFGGEAPPRRQFEARSLGSGFVIDRAGYVVTNAHVVAEADEILVQLSDRRQLRAELVGEDRATDLALLKVAAEGLTTVDLADGDEIRVGEWVVAMGAPFGFENSVTAGIVSAKGRSLPDRTGSYVPFLQTDVAINPGNSGGPLFNLDGEVVGVNAQIYSRSGGYMGLSFAIPAGVVREVVADLRSTGEVRHGWLGVALQDVSRELARSLGLDSPEGGVVTRVMEGSPAADAGLRPGDVIVAVGGEPVAEAGDIPPRIGRLKPGSKVTLTLVREGERIREEVTLGALSEAGEH